VITQAAALSGLHQCHLLPWRGIQARRPRFSRPAAGCECDAGIAPDPLDLPSPSRCPHQYRPSRTIRIG